jgi:hypothetical protein
MKTVKDLGALVKREHPKYRGLPDEEAGRMVKQQYPHQYKDFLDVSKKVGDLLAHYDPNRGWLSSWSRALKSKQRGELQQFLTNELRSVIEQGAMLEDAALSSETKKVEFQTFIVDNEYHLFELQQNARLLEQATNEGLTVAGLEQKNLHKAEWEVASHHRITEQNAATTEQIRLADALSQVKVRETQELESAQLDNELRRMNEQVRLALIAKALSGHQRIILVQGLLDGLNRQIDEIQNSPMHPSTKNRMIQDREAIIAQFKDYRDAEGARLI